MSGIWRFLHFCVSKVDSGRITMALLDGVDMAERSCSGRRLPRSTYSQASIFWTSLGGMDGHPGKAVKAEGLGRAKGPPLMVVEAIGVIEVLVAVAIVKLRWGPPDELKVGMPRPRISDTGGMV